MRRLGALVAFPFALAHELAHYFAALPFATDARILLDPVGAGATTLVDWDEDAPRWAVAIACVFPTVVGVLLATGALVWWGLEGLAMPDELVDWFRLSVGVLSWGVFSWPSREDVEAARNGPEEAGLRDTNPGGDTS